MRPEIAFARSADGTRIAWSRHGRGPTLVRAGTWLTNLERDWASPLWTHWLTELGDRFTTIRYDDRGSGLSDRNPPAYSMEAWVTDLEAVIDAAGLGSFALLGMSQGGAIAIAYAAAHPERVTRLILMGAYARGALARDPTEQQLEEADLRSRLIRVGWGRADGVFRRVFTTGFIPGASEAQMRWFDEAQRSSMDPDAALASSRARAIVDVTDLAPQVAAPTLVLHARHDAAVPFEEGRRLASLIPGARFVPLEGHNHLLLADEPAWPAFLDEVTRFVPRTSAAEPPVAALTSRELEVLRLVAGGYGNEAIAGRLALSTRTVERHLSNIYVKLSLDGRSARAAAAARLSALEPEHRWPARDG